MTTVLPAPRATTCCAPSDAAAAGIPPSTTPDAEALARSFKALADPTRLRLLTIVAASPSGEACVCDLVDPVGLSQPTVSHHLKILVDAGLLHREKRGVWAYYGLVPGAAQDVARGLVDLASYRSASTAPAADTPR